MGIPSHVCLLPLLFLLSYLGFSGALFRHLGRMTGNLGGRGVGHSSPPHSQVLGFQVPCPSLLECPLPSTLLTHPLRSSLSNAASLMEHSYLIHAFPRSICTLEEKLRGALCLNQSPDGLLRNSRHWWAPVSSRCALW